MLSTNILLSGNNFRKVLLLLKFMNMGCVAESTFYAVQGSYCVGAIQHFWEEKRAAIIRSLCQKDSIVALGMFSLQSSNMIL